MVERKYLQSIEQLENDFWKPLDDYPTGLVSRVYSLRKKPLKDLEPGDLRLLIGQDVGVQFLLPLAIDHLEPDIFSEASFFPGDLLKYVLQIKVDYWKNNPAQLSRMLSLLDRADLTRIGNDQEEEFIKPDIGDAISDFLVIWRS